MDQPAQRFTTRLGPHETFRETESPYFEGIDALRAVAILAVISSHVLPGLFQGGYLGVDLFFIVSGFLITHSTFQREGFSVWRFWQRRISRIVPPLFAVTVFIAGVAWLLPLSQGERWTLSNTLMGQAFFVQNFNFARVGGDYFSGLQEAKFNLHLWSIAIEEQFYLVFPIVAAFLLWVRPRGPMAVLYLVTLALVSFFWVRSGNPEADYYLTIFRVWELALGCLLGLAVLGGFSLKLKDRSRVLFEASAVALVFAPMMLATQQMALSPVVHLPLAIGASVLILMMAGRPGPLTSLAGSSRLMAGIGRSSYSLYLWHWPLFAFATYIWFDFGSGLYDYAGYLAALAVVSWISVLVLERGLRPLASLTAPLMLFGFSASTFWIGAHMYDPDRPLHPIEIAGQVSEICGETVCWHGEGDKLLVVYGDSHAQALWGVAKAFADENGMQAAGVFSCLPGRRDEACAEAYNAALVLSQRPETAAVLAVGRWSQHAVGFPDWEPEKSGTRFFSHDGMVAQHQEEMGEIWRASAADMVAAFDSAPFYIVSQVPQFPYFAPKEMLLAEQGFPIRGLFPKPLEDHRAEHAFVNTHFEALGVNVIDPSDLLCDELYCRSHDGLPLYHDDDHLSVHGAMLLHPLFEPLLGGSS